MKRILAAVMLVVMFFSVPISNIKAEGIITDSTIIHEQDGELFSYEVIFRDFHRSFTPEMFNSSGVTARKIEKSDYMEMDDSYTYTYGDGCELCVSSGLYLFYYNADGDCYSQILTYPGTAETVTGNPELTGFTVKEATSQCNEFLSRLGLGDLVLDTIVTFSKEQLIRITEEMKKEFAGHPVRYFSSITDETEAYYLTYRQVLNGVKSAGTPQVRIVITRDGIAYLEMFPIIDHIAETHPVTEQMSWQDAVHCFENKNINAYSVPDSIRMSYGITEISIAYYHEFDMKNDHAFHAYVFPGWYIKGYETIRSADRESTHPIQDFYRIPDGIWYYPE